MATGEMMYLGMVITAAVILALALAYAASTVSKR